MDNLGIISLEVGEINTSEQDSEVLIPIIRTEDIDSTVSVDISVNAGTAVAGSDYTSVSETLVFEPGETRINLPVPILMDEVPEASETFNVAIGSPIDAVLGDIRSAVITIKDDDIAEGDTLSFEAAEYSIAEDSGEASITLSRTGNLEQTATVNYTTEDDYARAESDYTTTSGTVTWDPSETFATFTVPILEDNLQEFDESLNLKLLDPVGSNLGVQDSAQLTINDNDEAPFTFEREVIVSGLAQGSRVARFSAPPGPTAFDWTPSGAMLIANLNGVVQIYDEGELQQQPFIDISDQVNTGGQRGLLGLAIHPDFANSPYVYLAFSYDPPGEEPDLSNTLRTTRLVRVEADPATNYSTVLPDSEVILLETPPVANFHAAGAIKFAEDGSLFFSHGDGTQVGGSPSPEQSELLQSLDNPFGKLFRIDPLTGEGLSDNPFFDGDAHSVRSKVYNYGLRNPWRYTLHPETGEPFIGDVGWTNWEEINTGRGQNFGWPLYEGGNGISLRTEAIADLPEFQDLYQTTSEITPPLFALPHPEARSITLGDFYVGTAYPEYYDGALFFADNTVGGVSALLFDEQGNVDSAIPFADEDLGITQISVGPDSNLYFANVFSGEIGRWVPRPSDETNPIVGDNGDDVLEGDNGDNLISGEGGNDVLNGNGGNDTLIGSRGADALRGGLGNDRLIGGPGDDTLMGGADNDTFTIRNFGGRDLFDGGDGIDTILFNPTDGRSLTLFLDRGSVGDGRRGGQFFKRVERLITGRGNDQLIGDANDNYLEGGAGNDSLIANAGSDTLVGGVGDDLLTADTSSVDTFVFNSDILNDGQQDIDIIENFGSEDILELDDYLSEGGMLSMTRVSSGQLQVNLSDDDEIMISGSAASLDIAENQLIELGAAI